MKKTKAFCEAAKATLLKSFEHRSSPVLVGPSSLLLGPCWGLEDTESLFVELVMQRKIRPLTAEEAHRYDCPNGYVLAAGVDDSYGTTTDKA